MAENDANDAASTATKPAKKSKLKEYAIFGSISLLVIGVICWVLGGQMQGVLATKFTPMFMKQAVLNLKDLPPGTALYAARDVASATAIKHDDVAGIQKIPADKPLTGTALLFKEFDGKPAKKDIKAGEFFTTDNAGP